MTVSKTFTAAALVLALTGVGCARKPAETPPPTNLPAPSKAPINVAPPPTTPPATSTAQTPEETPPPTPPSGPRPLTTTVTIDDTWKIYTNAALSFTFQWPSRGRFAPEWQVSFFSETDPQFTSGCRTEPEGATGIQPEEWVSVSGVKFCHSSYSDRTADKLALLDHYATKNDGRYIVITFTKTAYLGSPLACGFDVSTSSSACVEFNVSDYYSLLDQIISTFRYTN